MNNIPSASKAWRIALTRAGITASPASKRAIVRRLTPEAAREVRERPVERRAGHAALYDIQFGTKRAKNGCTFSKSMTPFVP